MTDEYLRMALATCIIAAFLVGIAVTIVIHLRSAKWKKLRMRGHPSAKLREFRKRR